MAPPLLFDISGIDQSRLQYSVEDIERVNPHRGAMRLIDGICYADELFETCLAFKDVKHDEFWVPGHIPGRPIFPGVLMIEAAAQLASFTCLSRMEGESFMGFGGVDKVKFRDQVLPGDRLLILLKQTEFRRRRCVCSVQGLVEGRLVFEGIITGMPMSVKSATV